MADMWSNTVEAYDDLMSKAGSLSSVYTDFANEFIHLPNPRTDGWFMVASPFPSLFLTIAYIFLVEYGIPKYMENRNPYELRKVMIIYNFSMVALSGYVFLEFGLSGWFTNYTLGCQMADYSNSPQGLRMISVCWWFYISKYIEFLDTVIFCLRKKTKQVSFLHVVHHSIMPFTWFWGVKYGGGGMGTFHALLNSFIHFMMYIYYGLAGLGPQYQKYLWWKKYMTKMQMLQFILCLVHAGQLFFTDCTYPKILGNVIFLYAALFLCLFAKFYMESYIKTHKKDAGKSSKMNGDTVVNGSIHETEKTYNNNIPANTSNGLKHD